MHHEQQIYQVKVDSSGRVALPAELRERHHITHGDTVIVVDDGHGMRIKTREDIKAEVQAYFANMAPAGVLLSEEILQDRRAEHERD